ncbi:unnamed protein product [Pseudo-nitzschia multistriata]|uniref:Uncharacterized protein n=1 Tax=Pseudo-nitzschia multistriata TaxID=183589 RepID=A0A448ZQ20_9STRA|nr:unnamed protein product [Pseudo-nitzschia multistriata]
MNLKSSYSCSFQLLLLLLLQNADNAASFSVVSTPYRSSSSKNHRVAGTSSLHSRTTRDVVLYSTNEGKEPVSEEQKAEAVGNLVENDEWEGLTMELSEVIKMAVVEDIKKNTADFIGKDNYQVGDITKEIDNRVKSEIASMRGNDEYQLGDLIVVIDGMVSGTRDGRFLE